MRKTAKKTKSESIESASLSTESKKGSHSVNNKQILDVVKAVSYEMEVNKEVIFEAIEAALEIATQKRYLDNVKIKVVIDRKTGNYTTYRQWEVIDSTIDGAEAITFDPNQYILLQDAKLKDPSIQIGGFISEPIESIEFGRIAAQIAKQVIVQKVREAKREKVASTYQDRVGQLITGTVKKVFKDGVTLELSDAAEVFIPREEMLPGEMVHINDRLRAYLYEIKTESKGPLLYATRARKEMLQELFRIEVPEIGEEVIEIKAIARDPGVRSKIAVKTKDGRIDPIGACVGMRGSRVQAISNELNGERIDIILWDDNPAQLVINALTPAEIASIVMDEDTHTMDIAVDESQLSPAIGRNGQNVGLASQLTGWTLNIMSIEEAQQKAQTETLSIQQQLVERLGIDDTLAQVLVREGFTSVEEIAYVPIQELQSIPELNEEIIQELRERSKQALEKKEKAVAIDPDLLSLEGMTQEWATQLASHGIKNRELLAEQSVDEMLDIINDMPIDTAKKLIMKAREHWFQ